MAVLQDLSAEGYIPHKYFYSHAEYAKSITIIIFFIISEAELMLIMGKI